MCFLFIFYFEGNKYIYIFRDLSTLHLDLFTSVSCWWMYTQKTCGKSDHCWYLWFLLWQPMTMARPPSHILQKLLQVKWRRRSTLWCFLPHGKSKKMYIYWLLSYWDFSKLFLLCTSLQILLQALKKCPGRIKSDPVYIYEYFVRFCSQRGLRIGPIQRNGRAPGVIHTGCFFWS